MTENQYIVVQAKEKLRIIIMLMMDQCLYEHLQKAIDKDEWQEIMQKIEGWEDKLRTMMGRQRESK